MNPLSNKPETDQPRPSADTICRKPGKAFSARISVTLLTLVLATTPIAGLHADDGYLVMQYQFELSKKPKFRQLNLAYQEGVGGSIWTYYGESGKPAIIIPLYSTDPRKPGLFNSLDKPQSEEDEGEPKAGIGAILSTILGIGVIAAYAYATGKCAQDISNAVNQSAACDAVSSGW